MSQKKLYKDSKNGQFSGVCAGLADYLNMDVSIVRIIMVCVVLFTGVGILPYIILMIVLPEKPVFETVDPREQEQEMAQEDDLYSYNEDDYTY